MKLAIMQPYFLPYIGYFELINSVDKFVFLNDVQYINRGWVNRNKLNNQYINIPVCKHKQTTNINDIKVFNNKWFDKIKNQVKHSFGEKKLDHPLMIFLEKIKNENILKNILTESIKWISNYLNFNTVFEISDAISNNKNKEKIKDICLYFKATEYYNLSGGINLYEENYFVNDNIKLNILSLTKYENKNSILELLLTEEEKVFNWFSQQSYKNQLDL